MTPRHSNIIFLFILLLSITSCTTALIPPTGVKSIQPIDKTALVKQATDWKIPLQDIYELDTAYYTYINQNAKNKDQVSTRFSPLQALYYDSSKNLISYQTSAFALGFPNLKWNHNKTFEEFVPKFQTPPDTLLKFEKQFSYFKPINETERFDTKNYDYVIVVHWNKFTGRQSRNLIQYVQKNTELAKTNSVKVIYVNNDNYYNTLQQNNQPITH